MRIADLSPEGKSQGRTQDRGEGGRRFPQVHLVGERAQLLCRSCRARWNAKIDEAIKPAADHGQAVTYGQIRGHIAGLDEKARLAFIDKHLDDADGVVVSAVLTAPEFLSGLTVTEIGLVRDKLARRTFDAEIIAERERVAKAMAVAERGWLRAATLIEERGGLRPVKARAA